MLAGRWSCGKSAPKALVSLSTIRWRSAGASRASRLLGSTAYEGSPGSPRTYVRDSQGSPYGRLRRALDSGNPVAGATRLAHVRDEAIDAKPPEVVEAIRAVMRFDAAVHVSVLAYEGLRPGEAFALQWRDLLDNAGKPLPRVRVQRALSAHKLSTTQSRRIREPELFKPVKADLAELYLARGGPDRTAIVFPDTEGGHLRRHNWRKRVWIPALEAAGIPTSGPTTCATLARRSSSTKAAPSTRSRSTLGHGDPRFTARVYTHVLRDAPKRRRVPIDEAIARARRSLRVQP